MRVAASEHPFRTRHALIDRLRAAREVGETPVLTGEELDTLLDEVLLLELVAATTEELVEFVPVEGPVTPVGSVQTALRRWKA